MKQLLPLLIACLGMACTPKSHTLTVLHTNDTHSQVEPKADGKGGYALRMGQLNAERQKDPNLLLVDAGDFCQGTPYFNFFRGRVEVDAMNRMGYDVVTLGNHEFDNGVDSLANILQDAQFEIVCANYLVDDTPLEGIVKPYTILRKGGLKIGVFGLGVRPDGLIADVNFAPLKYLPPYRIAQEIATMLRQEQRCDVVICLSHMGTYPATEESFCDVEMAAKTRDIDLIVGGHTHQIYTDLRIRNLDGIDIPIVQAGQHGAQIGKVILNLQ